MGKKRVQRKGGPKLAIKMRLFSPRQINGTVRVNKWDLLYKYKRHIFFPYDSIQKNCEIHIMNHRILIELNPES